MNRAAIIRFVLAASLCAGASPAPASVWDLLLVRRLPDAPSDAGTAAGTVGGVLALTRARLAELARHGGVDRPLVVELQEQRLVMADMRAGLRAEGRAAVGPVEGWTADLPGWLARIASSAPADGVFVMTAATAAGLGPALQRLAHQRAVHVAEPGLGRSLPLVVREGPGGVAFYRQLGPRVWVPLRTELPADALAAWSAPLRRERARVVPMFAPTEVEPLRRIAQATGTAMETPEGLLQALREGSLKRWQGGLLIVVGHVEGAAFVARGLDGAAHRIDLHTLERLAAQSDLQVVSAGCASACAGAGIGFLDEVTDAGVAASLHGALRAHTLGEAMEAFAQAGPVVLNAAALDELGRAHRLQLTRLERGGAAAQGGVLVVRGASVVAAGRREALAGALDSAGQIYLVGLMLTLPMWRLCRAGFGRSFPPAPSLQLSSSRGAALRVRAGRALLFVVFAPLFNYLVALTLLVGGWSRRETTSAWLWRLLREPHRAVPQALGGLRRRRSASSGTPARTSEPS